MRTEMFDYSRLTAEERAYLKALAAQPDDEIRRRAWAGDPVAWLEYEARWAISRAAWQRNRFGPEPPEMCPMPEWVKLAWEARRTPRTQHWPVRRGTPAYPTNEEIARQRVNALAREVYAQGAAKPRKENDDV